MGNLQMVFDSSVKREILELFDKGVNEYGMIIEKDRPDEVVRSIDGIELSLREFGGVINGSELFVNSNIASMMKLVKGRQ